MKKYTPRPDDSSATRRRGMGTVAKITSVIAGVALTTLAVGGAGLVAVDTISDINDTVYTRDIDGITQAEGIRLGFTTVRMMSANAALQTDDAVRQQMFDERSQVIDELLADSEAFAQRGDLTDEERTAAQTVHEEIATFVSVMGRMDQLFAEGESEAAIEIRTDELIPAVEAANAGLAQITQLKQETAAQARAEAQETTRLAMLVIVVIGLIGLVISFIAGRRIGASIVHGLRRVVTVAEAAARGDLSQRTGVDRDDETGQAARALDSSLEQIGGLITQVSTTSEQVADAVAGLHRDAKSVANGAEDAASQAGAVTTSASRVSDNVQTVAAGTEEMTASIREIAKSANDAAGVAASAVAVADTTNTTVAKLGVSSAEVGEVIKTITSIAEQTNLLALNATIEAARAGEAGKGFAVVANEVKDLAQETAKATEDISRRVEQIQDDTQAAVAAIAEISSIIAQINDTQATIASAVEEQTATTNEMGRNVSEAADGSSHIARSIDSIASATGRSTATLRTMGDSFERLDRMSRELRERVHAFSV